MIITSIDSSLSITHQWIIKSVNKFTGTQDVVCKICKNFGLKDPDKSLPIVAHYNASCEDVKLNNVPSYVKPELPPKIYECEFIISYVIDALNDIEKNYHPKPTIRFRNKLFVVDGIDEAKRLKKFLKFLDLS